MMICGAFGVNVCRRGYAIVEGILTAEMDTNCRQKFLTAKVTADDTKSRFPLNETGVLYRRFSKINETTSAEIAAFADTWGLLGGNFSHRFRFLDGGDEEAFDAPELSGEVVDEWAQEIRRMRDAIALWTFARQANADPLTSLVRRTGNELYISEGNFRDLTDQYASLIPMPLSPISSHSAPGAILRVALLSYLQHIIKETLERHRIDIIPAFNDSVTTVVLELKPQNLIAAIWLQFAHAVETEAKFYDCEHCGEPLDRPRGSRSTTKKDFCNDKCRGDHFWNEKRKEARRLDAAGLPLEQIATQLKLKNGPTRRLLTDKETRPRQNRPSVFLGRPDGKGPLPPGYRKGMGR